jgi:hypothetical protein
MNPVPKKTRTSHLVLAGLLLLLAGIVALILNQREAATMAIKSLLNKEEK